MNRFGPGSKSVAEINLSADIGAFRQYRSECGIRVPMRFAAQIDWEPESPF